MAAAWTRATALLSGARSAARKKFASPASKRFAVGTSFVTYLDCLMKTIDLLWFRPHAHMRAKSVQYKLIYPDGKEETILNVPHYDFNWQLTYRTSLKIPKGSRIHVEFWYDNSPNNKYNPDSTKWIYYGDQSWEEMGTPNMGFLVDRDSPKQAN